jgi:Reverse transcriptase (RNA-dependent DNA polymerase)
MSRDVRWTDKFYGQSETLSLDECDILTSGTEEAVVDDTIEVHGAGTQVNDPENVQLPATVYPEGRTLRSGRIIGTQRDIELFTQFGSRGAAEIQRNEIVGDEVAQSSAVSTGGTPTQNENEGSSGTEIVDLALVSCINSTMAEPKTYEAAMKSISKSKWKKAMRTEFANINAKKVWRIIKKSQVQPGKTILGTKWVYKIKSDGRYRARLVVKGYNQIPGVDFTESHSPVATDVTIRLLLVLIHVYNWYCETIDVETAFLYGLLQELVYLHLPAGINDIGGAETSADDVVVLDKALYGLVQASRVWLNTLIAYLLSIGFTRSRADPCLLWRSGIDGFVVFLVYVDDCLICGSKDGIKNCITDIKKRFNISEMGILNEYVGAKYKRIADGYSISQSAMIDEFTKVFDLKGERPSTPAVPGQVLLKSHDGDVKLDAADQTVFRSGVGKLLYLTKLSRPDMSSAVRELATHMDGANVEHKKALFRALEYAVHTKDKILTLKPKKSLEGQIVGYSDSNYASNKDTRRSVSGFAVYYMGGLISWKSKAQNCVTMSSTEAEYVAMSSCAMEMMFIKQVVESITFEVKLPMILYCDNAGAIDLARNFSTGGRTKHIDVRHHYLRELIDQGYIKVEFVGTADNVSDIFKPKWDALFFVASSLAWPNIACACFISTVLPISIAGTAITRFKFKP